MPPSRTWECSCERYCRGVTKKVSKSTYHNHARFRQGQQPAPISAALLASHAIAASLPPPDSVPFEPQIPSPPPDLQWDHHDINSLDTGVAPGVEMRNEPHQEYIAIGDEFQVRAANNFNSMTS